MTESAEHSRQDGSVGPAERFREFSNVKASCDQDLNPLFTAIPSLFPPIGHARSVHDEEVGGLGCLSRTPPSLPLSMISRRQRREEGRHRF